MTIRITVSDGTRSREAAPRESAASAEVLALLGFETAGATAEPRSPLGDTLAGVVASLALDQEGDLLVCAEVVESEEERLRVGDVVAAGEVDALATAARSAPGRLTIVADHDDPKESMAERLRATLAGEANTPVMGVLTLGEAADRLLGLRERGLAGSLVPSGRQARAREALFEGTLVRSRLGLAWPLVNAVAIGLLGQLAEDDDRARFELELVRDVAARHAGRTAPIPWPEDDELAPYTADRRLTILAQVVQSVADGGWGEAPEYAARARRAVGALRSVEALKLLGAAGRAFAAVGDHDGAIDALDAALAGWLAEKPGESSYALSELLRIEGIRGRVERVNELRATAGRLMSAFDADAKPYVTLAVGRALVQTERAAEALQVFEGDGVGSHAPRHVKTAAQRWRAVAARKVRSADDVTDALARLDALGASDQRLLAQLDGEAFDVRETTACLDALLALPGDGDEARRFLDRLGPGLSTRAIAELPDVVRRLRAEYRY